jgi:hypothetical protein
MEETPVEIGSNKMFGGYNKRYKHYSSTLGCAMTFSVFFPPTPPSQKLPVINHPIISLSVFIPYLSSVHDPVASSSSLLNLDMI